MNSFFNNYKKNALQNYQDPVQSEQANILFNGILVTAISGFFYAFLSYLISFYPGFLSTLSIGIIFSFFLLFFSYKVPLKIIGISYIFIGFINNCICIIYSGGWSSPVLPWMASTPLAALLLINRKWANIFLILSIIFTLNVGWLAYYGYELPKDYNTAYIIEFSIFCYVGLILLVIALSKIFENEKLAAYQSLENSKQEISDKNKLLEEQAKQLEQQKVEISFAKEQSDNLLLNILPEEVAIELKSTGKSKAKSYDHISVMFIDFVNFTSVAKSLNPEELVGLIDFYFRSFDQIMGKFHIEKIKTVGDAYLSAGGLFEDDTKHEINIIKAGLEIIDFITETKNTYKMKDMPYFETRIGIHVGSVTAGIVGEKKFAYDIWGDAVNIASRLESYAEPNKIHISEYTYTLIKYHFKCRHRGSIQMRNIGMLETYYVEHVY